MRIAYITYEYPPDIPQGGIATYVQQTAQVMLKRGHEVEIFCASGTRTISEVYDGVLVHRSKSLNPSEYQFACVSIFEKRHFKYPFDVIECPEIHANALKIKEKYAEIPLMVKLHMPLFLQMRLYNYYTPLLSKFRFFLGGLKRGRINIYGKYNYKIDPDYIMTMMAEGISSPSLSLKNILSKEWKIKSQMIDIIPYPFQPSKKSLLIPIENKCENKVTFVGKLNVHKGIVNIIKIIPLIVKDHPEVMFTLIGNDSFFGLKKILMSNYIRLKLKGYEKNYEIKGALSYDQILKELEDTTVCIFPSIWENFPMVCLEAMSAGKAIIGSKNGGMNEMLSDGAGIIVDPLNVIKMVDELKILLTNKSLRYDYGEKARTKLLKNYNEDVIGKMMENSFENLIRKKST